MVLHESCICAAQSRMCFKESWNLIAPCDWLLQEPVAFLRKFSPTFHELTSKIRLMIQHNLGFWQLEKGKYTAFTIWCTQCKYACWVFIVLFCSGQEGEGDIHVSSQCAPCIMFLMLCTYTYHCFVYFGLFLTCELVKLKSAHNIVWILSVCVNEFQGTLKVNIGDKSLDCIHCRSLQEVKNR